MSHKKQELSPCPLQTHRSMWKPLRADDSEGTPMLSVDTNSPHVYRDLLACDSPQANQGRVWTAQHSSWKLENTPPTDRHQLSVYSVNTTLSGAAQVFLVVAKSLLVQPGRSLPLALTWHPELHGTPQRL